MALRLAFEYTDITVPGANWSPAFDINNRGQVVGLYGQPDESDWLDGAYLYDGGLTQITLPGSRIENVLLGGDGTVAGRYHAPERTNAFVYSQGTVRDIDLPDTLYAFVDDINGNGQVIGQTFKPGYFFYVAIGYVYSGGKVTALEYPGSYETGLAAINNSGNVVGSYHDAIRDQLSHAFIYRSGDYAKIDINGGNYYEYTYALGISDRNDVFGGYDNTRGFLATAAGVTLIDFPDAQETHLKGINIARQLAGDYVDTTPVARTHGFMWDDGQYTTIDMPGASSTTIVGINRFGVVVGNYTDLITRQSKGFLWYEGKSVTISPPGAYDTVINGFNDWGQVVGSYRALGDSRTAPSDGPAHGFIANPTIHFDAPQLSFIQSPHPATTASDSSSAPSPDVRQIGVSSFTDSHVADLLKMGPRVPAQLLLSGILSGDPPAAGAVPFTTSHLVNPLALPPRV